MSRPIEIAGYSAKTSWKRGHPGLTRVSLDLRDLVDVTILRQFADSASSEMSFYDSRGDEIITGLTNRDFCRYLSEAGSAPAECDDCSREKLLRQQVSEIEASSMTHAWNKVLVEADDGIRIPVYTTDCNSLVKWTMAPVSVNTEVLGWVAGPQILTTDFLSVYGDCLFAEHRKQAEQRVYDTIDIAQLRKAIGRTTAALQEICSKERRKRISLQAKQKIRRSQTPDEIFEEIFKALRQLFGALHAIYFYVLSDDGSLYPKKWVGRNILAEPPKLAVEQGHVGLVIRQRASHYEGRLSPADPHFHHNPSAAPPPKSVFTAPAAWGLTAMPAALQIQSLHDSAFTFEDREVMENLLDFAGVACVQLSSPRERELTNPSHVSHIKGPSLAWDQFLLQSLLVHSGSASDTLNTRKRVYRGFAQEVMACAGTHCIAASIRIWNSKRKELGYVECLGDVWNPEAKDTFYRVGQLAAGVRALEQDDPFYLPNVAKARDYNNLIPEIKSLLAKRFRTNQEVRGVVTVSWDCLDGMSPQFLTRFSELLRQFEAMLSVLAHKQDVFFRELETFVPQPGNLNGSLKDLVEALSRASDAPGCSIFLDGAETGCFELVGTTHLTSTAKVEELQYSIGQGFIGWVVNNKRPLRLRNCKDLAELINTANDLQPDDRWMEEIQFVDPTARISFLAVPMIAREKVLGVLALETTDAQREFSYEDELFLEEAAERLSRQFDTAILERSATEKQKSIELAEKLRTAGDLEGVSQVILEEFIHNTKATWGYLITKDTTETFPIAVGSGIFKALLADGRSLPITSTRSLSPTPADDPAWQNVYELILERFGEPARTLVKDSVILPLPFKDITFEGTLVLCWRTPERCEQKVDDLDRIAVQGSIALEPMLLQTRTRRQLDRDLQQMHQLHEISLAFTTLTHDAGKLMDRVLQVSLEQSGMEFGTIRSYDEQRKVWLLVAPKSASRRELPQEIATHELLERCRRSKTPVFIEDTAQDSIWSSRLATLPEDARKSHLMKIRSWLGIPMRLENEFLGLILLKASTPRELGPKSLEFLETVAFNASVAFHSASLFQKEMELARPFALIGSMLSGFTHAMGNKLHNAYSTLSRLTDPQLIDDVRAQKLNDLRVDLDSIRGICQDLVRFCGSEESSCKESVNLNDLLDRCWADFSDTQKPNITFSRKYQEPSFIIRGNMAQLEIAFKMLIQNALEAMPSGGEFFIQTKTYKSGKGFLVRFVDTGVGMDRETREKCLRPFFTTKPSGNGLGLPVVLGIAARHGAKICIRSRKGRGCSFRMIFPDSSF